MGESESSAVTTAQRGSQERGQGRAMSEIAVYDS